MKTYSGNRLPFLCVLCHSEDADKIQKTLELLEGHGFRICLLNENSKPDQRIRKCFAALPVLSENFARSDALAEQLIAADAMDKNIIPVNLDDSAGNDSLNRIFHARNIVFRSKYAGDEEFAERILTAEALKNPSVTEPQKKAAKLMTVGAVLAAAVLAVLLFLGIRSAVNQEEPAPTQETQNDEFLHYRNVVLAGDQLTEGLTVWDVCVGSWEDDEFVWLRLEDGSVVEPGTEQDLSFLQYMTNLEHLTLVNQTASELPDLSMLSKLSQVEIWNCPNLQDVSALSGCPSLTFLHLTAGVSDLSQISSFQKLRQLDLTDDYRALKNLNGFAPPNLQSLQIHSESLEDISDLGNCSSLRNLELHSNRARDYSCLGQLAQLETLDIEYCDNCRDLSSLKNCPNLKRIKLQDLWNLNGDMSCLENHKKLTEIGLFCNLNSLDFLETLKDNGPLNLGFCDSRLTDFEALRSIERFSRLHVNLSKRDFGLVQPYLADAKIGFFELYDCSGVNLSEIPDVTGTLQITNGDLQNLEGLKPGFSELQLWNMQYLTSLNGLEFSDVSRIGISSCLRLSDYEALYERKIAGLKLRGQYSMPDFKAVDFAKGAELRLEDMPEMDNIDFLPESIHDEVMWSLALVGNEKLFNLKPLESMNIRELTVSPELEDQAQALQDSGKVSQINIEYPDTGWRNGVEFSLLSLEEIDTLPDVLLQQVTDFILIGDTLVEPGADIGWHSEYDDRGTHLYLDCPEDKRTEVGFGNLQSFEKLSKLTGLRRLVIFGQPLESLEGIRNLRELEDLWISDCSSLEDISQMYSLTSLRNLNLNGLGIRSLEGVQNLRNLEELRIPDCHQITDFSALSGLSDSIRTLQFCNQPAEDWVDAIPAKALNRLELINCFQNQEELETVLQKYPDVQELLLSWNQNVTDLAPLLSMKNLTKVTVSFDMGSAIMSLDGEDYAFELEIEGE